MNTEAFISEILNRPPIWMSKHPHHEHKNVINKLWEEINERFPECEVEKLKKKWKHLKDKFWKELKKIPTSSSVDVANGTQSQWKYFYLLIFLKEELMQIEGVSYLNENEIEDIDISSLSDVQSPSAVKSSLLREVSPQPSNSPTSLLRNRKACDVRADVDSSSLSDVQSPPPVKSSPPQPSNPQSPPPRNINANDLQADVNISPLSDVQSPPLERTCPPTPLKSPSPAKSSTPRSLPPREVSPQPSSSQSPPRKRKASEIRAEHLKIERRKLKVLEEQSRQNMRQNIPDKTDDYYFLMSLLPEMRKLTIVQKIRLRNKINQALMRAIYEEYGDTAPDS